MDALRTLLETQPLLTLFLTIALGYVVGEINIKGFSLGSGAVLFVGLAIGGFAPKAAPPAVLGTLGLLLFSTGVGIQYGAQFFRGMTTPEGLKANAAAFLGVLGAGGVALALVPLAGIRLDEALGMFAGSGTSTATLQAIIATLKGDGAAVGYSVGLSVRGRRPDPLHLRTQGHPQAKDRAACQPGHRTGRDYSAQLRVRRPAPVGIGCQITARRCHRRDPPRAPQPARPTVSCCATTTCCWQPAPVPKR